MKNRKKALVPVAKFLFCIFLVFAGYILNEFMYDREHRFPRMPKLPKAFRAYHFENVDAPWNFRNDQMNKFYRAWTNNETYGIYEAGMGMDSVVRSYWLTENGKIKLIRVIETPFWTKRAFPVWELNDISLGYLDENHEFVPIDPAANYQHDLILKAGGQISKSVIREY